MDIYAMSHFRDYLDLYQSKLSFPLLIPKGLNIPSPATGSSYIPLGLTSSIPVGWRQPSYEILKGVLKIRKQAFISITPFNLL